MRARFELGQGLKLATETVSKDVKDLQLLECHKCPKTGHIQIVCRSKGSASTLKGERGLAQTGKRAKAQGAIFLQPGESRTDDKDTDGVMFTLFKRDELDMPAEELFV